MEKVIDSGSGMKKSLSLSRVLIILGACVVGNILANFIEILIDKHARWASAIGIAMAVIIFISASLKRGRVKDWWDGPVNTSFFITVSVLSFVCFWLISGSAINAALYTIALMFYEIVRRIVRYRDKIAELSARVNTLEDLLGKK